EMVLVILLILELLILTFVRFSVLEFVQPVAHKMHIFCLQKLPENAISLPELKALVCAENFSNLADSQLYISSGLIHLFVVSGAHLVILEQIFMNLNFIDAKNKRVILPILILYAFLCNLNPPVTRCLVSYILSDYLGSKNIKWPTHFKVLVIGLFTLSLNPDWIGSLSLQMSWMASLAVAFNRDFLKSSSLILQHLIYFILLYPIIIFMQTPSFMVILINLFLAPVLEFILFPLGLLVWIFNAVSPVFDVVILVFQKTLRLFELQMQPGAGPPPSHFAEWIWLLIFVLHFILHLIYVVKRRHIYESH
ncbi:MAG: ComEC/Rec2 family competence protein, partial [Pseudobdellovibrio sp.]